MLVVRVYIYGSFVVAAADSQIFLSSIERRVTMFPVLLLVWPSSTGFIAFISLQNLNASLPQKGPTYKLPGG